MDQTIQKNLSTLGVDDLIDAYDKLADSYRSLKSLNENLQQKVYEQNRSLQLVTSNEAFLQSELETLSSVQETELNKINLKNSSTIEDLKIKNQGLLVSNSSLESKTQSLTKELFLLSQELERVKSVQIPVKSRLSEDFSNILQLEQENRDLKCCLAELKEKIELLTKRNSDYEATQADFKESLYCLEENLESKKHEIEEKNYLMEGLQEKYQELSLELTMLKAAPADGNRKGNSLFAEVDDHRQKIKHAFESQSHHYIEMKNQLRTKELEIRGLKRKNINIKQEIELCQNLFMRADQSTIQTLNDEISQLTMDKHQLESKVKSNENTLLSMFKDNNIDWIQPLLESSNMESKELKEKLYKSMLDKNHLQANFQKTQKDLAKAKLESIKMKLLLGKIVDANQIEINAADLDGIDIDPESLKSYKDSNDSPFSASLETVPTDSAKPFDPNFTALLNESLALEDSKENVRDDDCRKVPENIVRQTCQISKLRSILVPKAENIPKFNEIQKQSVHFSEIVKTEHISKTSEQLQDAKAARKKFNVPVKRIQIISKSNKS